jgi:proteasome lid subunit RPN8/RPN11
MWKIRAEVWTGMVEHARRERPREACGLLAGAGALLSERIECSNGSPDPRRFFEIPPAELFAAFRGLRERGLEPRGIYHSHPDGSTEPSRRDFEEFFYPAWSYWIVSFPGGEPVVRCFRWTERGFSLSPYRMIPPGSEARP